MLELAKSRLLQGAALGAGTGLGVQALRRADHTGRPEDRPSLLKGLLYGGLAGAAGGGLAAVDAPRQVWNDSPQGQVAHARVLPFYQRLLDDKPWTPDNIEIR
jgi:hypothetical protein